MDRGVVAGGSQCLKTTWFVIDLTRPEAQFERLVTVQGLVGAVHMRGDKVYYLSKDNDAFARNDRQILAFSLRDREPILQVDQVGVAFFLNDYVIYNDEARGNQLRHLDSGETTSFAEDISAYNLERSTGRVIRAGYQDSVTSVWQSVLISADLWLKGEGGKIVLAED